jgi:tetratricopeptide (TPR) repeat protein
VDQTLAFGDVYSRLAQPDRALRTYEAALRLVPRAGTDRWTLTILHLIGDIYLQRAAWKEALQVYLQIRKMAPRDDKASLRLIDLYFKLGRDPETENELAHLIALYDRTGETDKLITLVHDMATLRPRNSVLRNYLIDLLIKAGRTEQAIGELQGLGEAQVSARQTRDAIQTFERLIRLAPTNADSYRQVLAQLKADR